MTVIAPFIRASVTFLAKDEGGRATPARDTPLYRPHLVVGDPTQRRAKVASDGSGDESYLGVRFIGGTDRELVAGRPHDVELELCYFPSVDYTALAPDAQFTIREGGTVVGFGRVVAGPAQPPNTSFERTREG